MNAVSPVETLVTDHLDLWTAALKRKSTAGRGSSSKVELYGIKKLRELILELAVRGLLVPQNPNDEPASELLKRIAAEKAGLVKAGKIKKEKPLPPIAELEKPFELPVSWSWEHLADVFYPISVSKNKVKTSELSEEGKHPVVDQGQSFIAGYVDDESLLNILPGPVIVFGDHTSALKYVDFNFVAGADGVKILRPIGCDERYFFLVCKTLPIESRGYGRHYSRLVGNFFPLPPLVEQHRIVAKVDELMALCDQLEQQTDASLGAHQTLVETLLSALTSAADHTQFASAWQRIAGHFDTLFTTEESIAQLKQTLLQLAVMGKLVPQDPNDEPASELLKKIAARPDKHTLPGWATVSLGQLGDILGGATPSKSNAEYWTGNIPWISPKDMKRNLITDAEDHVSEAAISNSSLKKIPPGSLLMVVRGMILAHSFPVAISECEVTINQDMKALVIPPELGAYLLTFMQAMKGAFVALVDRSSHGTCKLVSEKLWSYPVSLPPLAEQHRIVAKVDELMALCDQLKSRLSDAQTTQLHLADALVERAIC